MNMKKTLCLSLIASLALSACDNQTGSGGAGKAPSSVRGSVVGLKNSVALANPDHRDNIIELHDVAVFDKSGVKPEIFYLDSTKGIQGLSGISIPPEALSDEVKFDAFIKANKDKFTALAANMPKPDNSLAMYYDEDHNSIHWVGFNDDKTKWQEYAVDVSKSPQMVQLLQESDIDPSIIKDNLAVSFRASDIGGGLIVDVSYSAPDMATDLDGQPVNGIGKISYLARAGVGAASESELLANQAYTPQLLGVNGVLENSYKYSGKATQAQIDAIKKLYPKSAVGDFAQHKEGFMDYLRNLSPVLALVTLTAIVTGLTAWRKGAMAKEIELKDKLQDQRIEKAKGSGNVNEVKDSLLSKDNLNLIDEKSLEVKYPNLDNSFISEENGIKEENLVSTEKYKKITDKNVLLQNANRTKVKVEHSQITADGFIGKFTSEELDVKSLKKVINRYAQVDQISINSEHEIVIKLVTEVQIDQAAEAAIRDAIVADIKRIIEKDFENRWFKKGRASIAAVISLVAGGGGFYIWKDQFGKLGSWVFGGCDKYVCNSTFLYGANSSESAIGMKADAIYQQIPFNDGSNNYIMNVVQVFSQNCAEMIKQSSESQTMVLYAGDSDVNVGKHYLVSDVNNKLCPIGNMDMSKFIESVGATQ
jgi:hypothetical protein